MTETITTILCIGLLSIYALLGVTFLIHSIADIFDNRRRAKREEEREKRDLEYHENCRFVICICSRAQSALQLRAVT